jgi:AcrR family transcriptional regulator
MRRNLIMDAAERVFAAKSFDKVNMREIAKEAGISPGTIYTYFPDQETLFVETSMRGAEELVEVLATVAGKGTHSVEEAAQLYIDFFMDHYEYMP